MHAGAGREWWRPAPAAARTVARPAASPLSFRGLLLFTFVLLLAPQNFFPALAPFRIALLVAVMAVTAYVLGRFRRGEPVFVMNRELWITFALVAWALLTLPLSYWPGGSVQYFTSFYAKTLLIFWLLANVVDTLPRLRTTAWTLSALSVPIAATAVMNYAAGVTIGGAHERVLGFESALTQNPNDLALMLNLILPMTAALFMIYHRPSVRLLLAGIAILNVIAIFTTYSRSGFLTLAVIFGLYLWHARWRPERKWLYAALLLGMFALPFAPGDYLSRIGTITDIEEDATGSAQERLRDSIAAVKYVAANPLVGAGLGNNALAMNEARGAEWREIHNVYLQYAVELGIPGAILFLMLLKGCIDAAGGAQRRSLQKPELHQLFYLSEGIRVSLIAFAVAAVFYPVAYHFYFYYFAGLALAARQVCRRTDESAGAFNDSRQDAKHAKEGR